MKDLILTVTIFSSFVSPVLAQDLCREQAQQLGYVGAIEVLRSCNEPAPQEVTEAAPAIKPAVASPASRNLLKARSEKVSFGLEDVYTQ